jgi:hypothetical protein
MVGEKKETEDRIAREREFQKQILQGVQESCSCFLDIRLRERLVTSYRLTSDTQDHDGDK